MKNTIKQIITITSLLFAIANAVIHVLLFAYSFNYPNIFANICFYALLITWIPSFMITNSEAEDDLFSFLQKTKPMAIAFVAMFIYFGGLGLWAIVKYHLIGRISFSEPITPEKAKIISAGYTLFFYLPIWLLVPSMKKDKVDKK